MTGFCARNIFREEKDVFPKEKIVSFLLAIINRSRSDNFSHRENILETKARGICFRIQMPRQNKRLPEQKKGEILVPQKVMDGVIISLARYERGSASMTRATVVMCMILVTLFSGVSEARGSGDADKFWGEFRRAVVSGDIEKVAAMTRFPFSVSGVVDSYPVRYYGPKKFKAMLKTLLNQHVVVSSPSEKAEIKTMLQVISEKKQVAPVDFQTPKIMRVELFRFDNIDGRWMFTKAFQEE